jgi:type II secretory pathway component GspD/PulD (secretin)
MVQLPPLFCRLCRFGGIGAIALTLFSCDSPERLPSDLSMENSKDVLRERVIAPIKGIDEDEITAFEPLPRRKLLQVKHSPLSLKNRTFISTLEKLAEQQAGFDSAISGKPFPPKPEKTELSDEARALIAGQRAFERNQLLVNQGLEIESELQTVVRGLSEKIEDAESQAVNGLGGDIPVFGRNLTEQKDGFMRVPNDLVFVGGKNGTFSSKTVFLKQQMENPVISFSVRDMPLADAMQFLFSTIGLQVTMSDDVLNSSVKVSLSLEASAIAIMDALMEQHDIAIVYDPEIEVAQIYTQEQFDSRMGAIRTSIQNYNNNVKRQRTLALTRADHARASELLQYAQLLLGGDDEGFLRGTETISRAPSGEEVSTIVANVTRSALTLRGDIIQFDQTTTSMLNGTSSSAGFGLDGNLAMIGDLGGVLTVDECVWPNQEIFTEKMAVYNALIVEGKDPDTGLTGKIKAFFKETRGDDKKTAVDNATITAARLAEMKLPAHCGTANPAPRIPVILPDDTGITVIGTREDNDLIASLIEQYDVPELQVLIEIFIITVSRDFSRQIDSILSAAPSGGGNNNQEAVLSQVARAASDAAGAGSFSLDLDSPNDELGSVLNFIESNKLGRVVSSPTILVAAGQDAIVKRDLIARVPGPKILDADNRSVDGPPVEYSAPFKLEIKKADINRLNNTVKLDVELTDTRFNTTLDKVNELSDKTSDVIDTVFWAAPGDVVVLAGLTRNEENTTTSGIPGTTGALSPLTPLVGGADKFSTNLSETIIFMAPTVIDPSAENQPHSAFRTRLRRKMQEASEADTTVDDDSQS